jgi:hypothetical protein
MSRSSRIVVTIEGGTDIIRQRGDKHCLQSWVMYMLPGGACFSMLMALYQPYSIRMFRFLFTNTASCYFLSTYSMVRYNLMLITTYPPYHYYFFGTYIFVVSSLCVRT